MDNTAEINRLREQVTQLRKAIRELNMKDEALGRLNLESLANTASDWWQGEHQSAFVEEIYRLEAVRRDVGGVISQAVSDCNDRIRWLLDRIEGLQVSGVCL